MQGNRGCKWSQRGRKEERVELLAEAARRVTRRGSIGGVREALWCEGRGRAGKERRICREGVGCSREKRRAVDRGAVAGRKG